MTDISHSTQILAFSLINKHISKNAYVISPINIWSTLSQISILDSSNQINDFLTHNILNNQEDLPELLNAYIKQHSQKMTLLNSKILINKSLIKKEQKRLIKSFNKVYSHTVIKSSKNDNITVTMESHIVIDLKCLDEKEDLYIDSDLSKSMINYITIINPEIKYNNYMNINTLQIPISESLCFVCLIPKREDFKHFIKTISISTFMSQIYNNKYNNKYMPNQRVIIPKLDISSTTNLRKYLPKITLNELNINNDISKIVEKASLKIACVTLKIEEEKSEEKQHGGGTDDILSIPKPESEEKISEKSEEQIKEKSESDSDSIKDKIPEKSESDGFNISLIGDESDKSENSNNSDSSSFASSEQKNSADSESSSISSEDSVKSEKSVTNIKIHQPASLPQFGGVNHPDIKINSPFVFCVYNHETESIQFAGVYK